MSGQVKIISIGAAVQDVFLQGAIFKPQTDNNQKVAEFSLGSKNEVDSVTYSIGGGASHASVTFARYGLRSYFMGHIGRDISGRAVLDMLRQDNVDTSLVSYNEKLGTGHATVMLAPNGERTILTYRGASSDYKLRESDFLNRTADWIYVSSLSGDMKALKTIANYAQQNNIKIAINPGKKELSERILLKQLLSNFTVLSLNREEMQTLFGGVKAREILKEAAQYVPIVLLTDGAKGSYATDGQKMYKAGMYQDVPVVDRTGAGDAFSSGFTAAIASGKKIEEALIFASANSTSVVNKIGAVSGILHSHAKLQTMDIEVSDL